MAQSTSVSGRFELVPPPAAVDREFKALGITTNEQDPIGYVRMPGSASGALHWTEALTRMRRMAQAGQTLGRFQQTPWWRSPTFLAFWGGLAALATTAGAVIVDPTVAEWIPAPWNKVLPVMVTLGVVPRMQKWLLEHRQQQESELADQRRAYMLSQGEGSGDGSSETTVADVEKASR